MSDRITVVVSKHRSATSQREFEAELLDELNTLRGLDIFIVPHLYDLASDGPVFETLRSIDGPLIALAWLYPRAASWILWAHGISDRTVRCLDLRSHDEAAHYRTEIDRLVSESGGAGSIESHVRQFDEKTRKRWYPVIDFDRCDHCLECLNFCLFGVYGVGVNTSILIEHPSACRAGCPACSRICPKGAILFPQHKDPAVAGDPKASHEELKLSLSQLFGGPDPKAIAEAERDKFVAEKDDLDRLVDDVDSMET